SDERLSTGGFVRRERGDCLERNVERVCKRGADYIGGFLPGDDSPKRAFERGRALVDASAGMGASVLIAEDERVADARNVTGQGQGAMLQHRAELAHLRAADQLLAVERDLVMAGYLKAHGAFGTVASIGALVRFGLGAEPPQPFDERRTDPPVAGNDVSRNDRVVGSNGHAVRQFVGVQDCASTRHAPDDIPAEQIESFKIDVIDRLRIPKRETGWIPGVKAQGG